MVASIACPSVVTQYSNTMDYSNVLLIGVSQSGGAADVYEVMKKCHEEGGVCVSITNVRDSLMTKTGSFYMNNECGPELSITAAKSYLTQTAMLIGIAAYISGNDELMDLLTRLPDIVAHSMELESQVESILPIYRNVEHLMIYGTRLSGRFGNGNRAQDSGNQLPGCPLLCVQRLPPRPHRDGSAFCALYLLYSGQRD